jgi:hypothetical protein
MNSTQGDVADNSPVEAPAALLLAPDPTGQSDVRFEYICDLSPAEHERYAQAYKTLFDILFANSFTYFIGSAKTFHSVWTEANKSLAEGEIKPNANPDRFVIWATQLRSVALSLCLSLVYHQEQTYQEICEQHGKDSEPHREAKTIFGELFDTYPGYRYMYGLKNVMAHDAMDAIALSATAILDENQQPLAMWDLMLDRSVMSKSPKLNAALKAEFASLTANPSVPELFVQIAEPMKEANRKLLGILHPDLSAACQIVVEFDALFEGKTGTRALAHNRSPELRPGMQVGFTSWPNQLIKFAMEYQRGQGFDR